MGQNTVTANFVLIHGGNCSGAIWSRIAPHLDGQVLAVDLPGRNDPGRHANATFEAWAASVVADMDRAGMAKAVFVGHSMGGGTLAALARLYPERADGFVYFAAVVPPDGGLFLEGLSEDQQAFMHRYRGDGLTTIPRPAATTDELANPQKKFVRDAGSSEALAPFFERVSLGGHAGQQVGFVKLLRDKSIEPERQNLFIERLSAVSPCAVRAIDGTHTAMVSQPLPSAHEINGLAGEFLATGREYPAASKQ